MNDEQRHAYEWAKDQNYPSVAAQYAKVLAEAIDTLIARLDASQRRDEQTREGGAEPSTEQR